VRVTGRRVSPLLAGGSQAARGAAERPSGGRSVGSLAQRTPWRAAVFGAGCGALLAAVIFAPARWVASALEAVSQGRVVVGETTGTVWQGGGVLTLTGGPGSRDAWTLPGRIGWTLGLAGAGLRVALTQDCCLPAPLVWRAEGGTGGLTLSLEPPRAGEPLAQWPAAWLAALGTPWNTLQPAGVVRLSSPGLRMAWAQGRWRLQGALRAEFVGMSSRLSTLPVLGSYRAELTAGGETGLAVPTVSVVTLEGPLQLSAQGQWAGDRWRLRGEARAQPGSAAALQNLLNLIGRRDGERAILSIG
jgi:general secretion pathway protein N